MTRTQLNIFLAIYTKELRRIRNNIARKLPDNFWVESQSEFQTKSIPVLRNLDNVISGMEAFARMLIVEEE